MTRRCRTPYWKSLALCSVLCLAAASCQREPLYELNEDMVLRLSLDLSLEDSTMIKKPTAPSFFKAVFYDHETHEKVSEMYCGRGGGQIYGVEPGRYDVLVYNYDTEYTRLMGENNFYTVMAYTEEAIARSQPAGRIIREPDHLLVARDTDFVIPYTTLKDTTIVIHQKLSTIMDSYSLRVDSLQGLENISSIQVYLTGHSPSNHIGPNQRSTEPVTLSIPCYVDLQNYCLYTEFCTFGKLPGIEGMAHLNIYVEGMGGEVYEFEEDITDQYLREDHHLRICVHGKIFPRQDSGFTPEVDEWKTEVTDIELF